MRVKYDVRGVETGERAILPAGVHVGTITGADVTKPDGKDQRIELVVKVSDNGTDYTLYEYVNLESEGARWKLRELLEAVGITSGKKGEAGTLDTDKMLLNKKLGLKTFVRPADDARGFDAQARIKRMFSASEASTSDEDLDDDTSAELDNGEEGTEYDDWTLADLRKEARSRGIKTAGLKADGIIDLLIEDDEGQEEEPEADAEDDGYDDMSLADLRKLARKQGIKTAGMKQDDLIEALREADSDEDEEEEEEEEETEASSNGKVEDDYDEWDLEDLRTELKDRSLATKGGTKVLIARLRRDDAEGDNPF
jgi:hypothetical protein